MSETIPLMVQRALRAIIQIQVHLTHLLIQTHMTQAHHQIQAHPALLRIQDLLAPVALAAGAHLVVAAVAAEANTTNVQTTKLLVAPRR